MGRTDSGRALTSRPLGSKGARGELVHAAARAWDSEPVLRRLAIATAAFLLLVDVIAFALLRGLPPIIVVVGSCVPVVPFVLVLAAFRATALARFGDARPRPEPVSVTVRRVAGRGPELVVVSWRALRLARGDDRAFDRPSAAALVSRP